MRIAVLGAGMSSASFSHNINTPASLSIFDKARGVGGRMSHRLVSDVGDFDHGAQFFTARTKSFQNLLQPLLAAGSVTIWSGKIGYSTQDTTEAAHQSQRYVAHPANGLVKQMLKDQSILLKKRCTKLEREADLWTLSFEDGSQESGFDWVVLSMPAPQAYELIKDYWQPAQAKTTLQPCFCLLIGLREDLRPAALEWDAAFVNKGIINWYAENRSKGRPTNMLCYTIHSTPDFAEDFAESHRAEMELAIYREFLQLTGWSDKALVHQSSHFWRYAKPEPLEAAAGQHLMNRSLKLALIGDYLAGGRVEGAYASGKSLADAF